MLSQNNHNIILPKYLAFVKKSPCEFFRKKESRRNPARIPPQTPPAGGKSAEAGRPRQIVSPCLVRISSFNHLDFARNSFELCPTNTAKIGNRNWKPKWGRHEVPTQMYSPQKILNLKGFVNTIL